MRFRSMGGALVLAAMTGSAAASMGCSRHTAPPGPPVVYASDEDGGFVVAIDPITSKVIAKIAVGKRLFA